MLYFYEHRSKNMGYKDIVIWVNENTGIIALIQTALTLFLSVLAVGITIHFSQLQYKKEIKIYSGLMQDVNENYNLGLWIYNVGNIPIYIKDIQVVEEYNNKPIGPLALGSLYLSDSNNCFLVSHMASSYEIPLKNADTSSNKTLTYMRIIIHTEEKTFTKCIDWALG